MLTTYVNYSKTFQRLNVDFPEHSDGIRQRLTFLLSKLQRLHKSDISLLLIWSFIYIKTIVFITMFLESSRNVLTQTFDRTTSCLWTMDSINIALGPRSGCNTSIRIKDNVYTAE